ncbi:MAG: hypothetical protein LBE09_04740 [Christensenellaceae bacterium]|jgi:predicted nuclease with TOPRIM domain|nr:hypothetical protein [Christensenellaceae bacterium]
MAFLFKKQQTTTSSNSETMRAQCARLEELKRENEDLRSKLETVQARESMIVDTLASARKIAKEYQEEAKLRFALECERLENYRSRWLGYVSNISTAEQLGEEIIRTNILLKNCADDMKRIINEDLPHSPQIESFISEIERISSIAPAPADNYMPGSELKRLVEQLANSRH